jgi:filamin
LILFIIVGFSIEGPSQAKIDCHDNGDGSADVRYLPTVPGEYAVHILCDDEDIPGSPYIAQVLPKGDFNPELVSHFYLIDSEIGNLRPIC